MALSEQRSRIGQRAGLLKATASRPYQTRRPQQPRMRCGLRLIVPAPLDLSLLNQLLATRTVVRPALSHDDALDRLSTAQTTLTCAPINR
jgi:hypothetical protein